MARIQVFHLPAPADEYPFAIIIDEAAADEITAPESLSDFVEAVGARGALIFAGTMEVT